MYTVAFEKEMLQDATLLVAVASAEALFRIADTQEEALTRMADALDLVLGALEGIRDVRQADAVRADTDSLRTADWPEPVVDGDAPTFEHGIEVGRARLITEIQNGEWPPELSMDEMATMPPVPAAPERWEPVDQDERPIEVAIGQFIPEASLVSVHFDTARIRDNGISLADWSIDWSAHSDLRICRRVEVSE